MISKYTVKVFFYSLFNFRKEYKKQMNLFCDTFYEHGLANALIFKFKIGKNKAYQLVNMAKKVFGYDISSFAAEEDYRVKRYCFDMLYFKINRKNG